MKKNLSVFLLAFSVFMNAQIWTDENFESSDLSAEWNNLSGSGVWSNNVFTVGNLAGIPCNGANTIYKNLKYNSSLDNGLWYLVYTSPFTSNGRDLSYSFQYLASGDINGYIGAEYSIDNGLTYNTLLPTVTLSGTSIPCTTVSGIIPAAAVPAGSPFKFRIRMWKYQVSYVVNYYMGIDNFKLSQTIDSPPSCTSLKTPTVSGTETVVDYTNAEFRWAKVPNARSYRLKVGTTSGGSEVYSENLYNLYYKRLNLPQNKILYASVTPFNDIGEATACPEINFQTNGIGSLLYCTGSTSQESGLKIKKVQLSKTITSTHSIIMENSSTSLDGYENFTSIITNMPNELGIIYFVDVYSSAVNSTLSDYKAYMWIDTDHNGFFDDGLYTIPAYSGGAYGNWRLGFSLPVSILQGNTRMRIRIDKSAEMNSVATPCGIGEYGQVEDYTLNVIQTDLGVVENEKKKISLYPNPFHDVLRLSDTKDIKSVVVSDFSGRIIKTLIPSKELDLSALQSGIYMISLNMQDGSVRIIKAIKNN